MPKGVANYINWKQRLGNSQVVDYVIFIGQAVMGNSTKV